MDHLPVLLQSACSALDPAPGRRYIDATFGGGGHSSEITSRGGEVLGIDQDAEVLTPALTSSSASHRLQVVHGNFIFLRDIARQNNFVPVDGILFDLGMSSMQLDDPIRGFSFQMSGPLDMRMDRNQPVTAEQLLNTLSHRDLTQILATYGDVRFAGAVARKIISARPVTTTGQLSRLLKNDQQKRQVFQAVRIAVNAEIMALETALPQAMEILKPGGRLVVISFHSLEDRVVKTAFRQWAQMGQGRLLTSKPVSPSLEELRSNPRSKSAKLRVIEKI